MVRNVQNERKDRENYGAESEMTEKENSKEAKKEGKMSSIRTRKTSNSDITSIQMAKAFYRWHYPWTDGTLNYAPTVDLIKKQGHGVLSASAFSVADRIQYLSKS